MTNPDRSGAFDDTRYCVTDANHYKKFISLFANSVTILGKRFDGEEEIEQIESFLDEVGNTNFQ
ncbi:hypothetical protein ACFVS2_21710 [Brevibacillus sp. NPDC058079]|uniref:hypothetical protein n=1 Tax=Brevibacillus sp. NPDC058079 TaxID=3346330 RepID=UPI0036E68E0A